MYKIKKISFLITIFFTININLVSKPIYNSRDYQTEVVFFYIKGCSKCDKMSTLLNKYIKSKSIMLKMFDIRKSHNTKLLYKVADKYDAPLSIPILFVGNNYLVEPNKKLLIKYINIAKSKNAQSPLEGIEYNDSNIRKVTLPAVIGAAAVDAFNPCACAVLALLLGTILLGSKSKKKVLGAGLAFTAATFISYTLMGLGLLKAIRISGLQQYIYLGASILAIILGLVNMKDYFNANDKFNIEVPDSWKG